MPKFGEVLPWVAANKDALLAIGAALAPVTFIIAAAVSYRAVVTGPKVQIRIAEQQNKLAERQQALNEKQFVLTEEQLRFAIIGTSEQKWISEFRDMLETLFGLADRASVLHSLIKDTPALFLQHGDELIALRDKAATLISRIWLHIGADTDRAMGFVTMLRQWFFYDSNTDEQFDGPIWVQRQHNIFTAAQRIISEHQAKISFNQTAAEVRL
jgi:hypothetical protein